MHNGKFQKNKKKIKKYRFGLISSENTLLKGCEREKTKIIVPFRSYPTRNRIFQKKIAKKFKKLKNTITASLQAKVGWKRLRKRENKNYCSVSFLPDAS